MWEISLLYLPLSMKHQLLDALVFQELQMLVFHLIDTVVSRKVLSLFLCKFAISSILQVPRGHTM